MTQAGNLWEVIHQWCMSTGSIVASSLLLASLMGDVLVVNDSNSCLGFCAVGSDVVIVMCI